MNEHELQRQAKHRLAILRHADEVSGSVAATCRYYGISRTRSTGGNGDTKSKAVRNGSSSVAQAVRRDR